MDLAIFQRIALAQLLLRSATVHPFPRRIAFGILNVPKQHAWTVVGSSRFWKFDTHLRRHSPKALWNVLAKCSCSLGQALRDIKNQKLNYFNLLKGRPNGIGTSRTPTSNNQGTHSKQKTNFRKYVSNFIWTWLGALFSSYETLETQALYNGRVAHWLLFEVHRHFWMGIEVAWARFEVAKK